MPLDRPAPDSDGKRPSSRLDISVRAGNARDFDLLRLGMSPLYEMDAADAQARAAFAAEMTSYHFADIAIASGWASAASFERSPLTIARGGLDNICLLVYAEGGCGLSVEGRSSEVHAGDVCILDMTRQSSLRAPHYSSLSLVLPRALLAPLVVDLDALHGRILQRSSALNAMLARHLRALYDQAPVLASKDAGAAAHGTAALVAAFAGASAQGREMIEQASAGTSLQAARRLIEANVPEPDLGPEFLCQRLGMSRAKLYRLFEPIGGVGAYIQQRRLTRAYHALTDPAQAHLYVGVIATRCGFGSASVFSRAFRQAFGLSPTDLRASHHQFDADNTNHTDDNAFTSMRRQLLGMGAGRR
ncbi:helix-turn-helix domain-containing protein [Aminobacter carboxidus]|uniref:Helix-turn-helix domain-containing protein n=1 Tax=Aminobacter carboxidus TaxID=376165 RepID=A0ABR9GY80_9HYPH|nr:helix-turn-helix domain-containing protein [Aminobacter carboxidus]MBE1208478.1 helix-turn-helix domain-containing protein [Aminobacter carboxidus]